MTLRLATSSPPPAAEQQPAPLSPAAAAATAVASKPAGIGALLRAVDDLPALPEVAIRVARLSSEDASGSTHAVAEAIAADPALAARMLRLANSAYYGVPRRIGTIREALLVLGLRTVRAITLAAAVHPALKGGGHWQHGIAAGVIAEMLARRAARSSGSAPPRLGHVSPDEAFVAGLLHDVGKVAIASVFAPAGMARRFHETLLATGQPSFVAERALLGFDHAEAGGALAEKWNLPNYLVDAVRWHHEPLRAGHGSAALAVLAHAASALSRHVRPGDAPAPPPSPLDTDALAALGLPADLDVLADEARAALDSAAPLFALGDAPAAAPAVLL